MIYMNKNIVEMMIETLIDECYSNIEVYSVYDYHEKKEFDGIEYEFDGIEFDLFDWCDKGVDFENEIEYLLEDLDEKLNANIFFKHEYTDEFSECDGELYPDYHCFVTVFQPV